MNTIKKALKLIKEYNPISIYYEVFKALWEMLKARKNA